MIDTDQYDSGGFLLEYAMKGRYSISCLFTSPLNLRYSAVSLRPQRLALSMHESRFSRAATTILHGPLKDYKECESEDAHAERTYMLVVPLL